MTTGIPIDEGEKTKPLPWPIPKDLVMLRVTHCRMIEIERRTSGGQGFATLLLGPCVTRDSG
jgi:hypothetical protein